MSAFTTVGAGSAYRLRLLCEPDGALPARRVRDGVGDDVEAVVAEKVTIFGLVEACVVERFTLVAPDLLTGRWTTVEQQNRTRRGMPGEGREHPSLIMRREVKEAVPGNDSVELAMERQRAHVGDVPPVLGETGSLIAIIALDESTPWT